MHSTIQILNKHQSLQPSFFVKQNRFGVNISKATETDFKVEDDITSYVPAYFGRFPNNSTISGTKFAKLAMATDKKNES